MAASASKWFGVTSDASGTQIVDALNAIFNEIQAVNSVFAATTLPVSANVQGTHVNQVYVGVFRPDANKAPRWLGNLKMYGGAEGYNEYAAWLRTIGEPVVPPGGALWILRVLLLAAVVVHIAAAWAVTLEFKDAEDPPEAIAKVRSLIAQLYEIERKVEGPLPGPGSAQQRRLKLRAEALPAMDPFDSRYPLSRAGSGAGASP